MEEKAANLLYFVVKNHSFSDGNKHIATEKNVMLNAVKHDVLLYILLIAESRPEDKDVMATLVVNLINGEN